MLLKSNQLIGIKRRTRMRFFVECGVVAVLVYIFHEDIADILELLRFYLGL